MASITDYARMCNAHDDCMVCPMYDIPGSCSDYIVNFPAEASAIIDKWCAEHPQKTYWQDFKEKFPKASVALVGCRVAIYEGETCSTPERNCADCWNEVMPEETGNE